MIERTIYLRHIEDVKKFVDACTPLHYDIDLISGKYTVNGKSIMGIFSLDLSAPINMVAHCDDGGERLLEVIKEFIAE